MWISLQQGTILLAIHLALNILRWSSTFDQEDKQREGNDENGEDKEENISPEMINFDFILAFPDTFFECSRAF